MNGGQQVCVSVCVCTHTSDGCEWGTADVCVCAFASVCVNMYVYKYYVCIYIHTDVMYVDCDGCGWKPAGVY